MNKEKRIKVLEVFFLFLLSLILFIFSILKVPYGRPTPYYIDTAMEMAKGGKVHLLDFYPLGYTTFLFFAVKINGLKTVFIFQGIMYILTVSLVYIIAHILSVKKIFRVLMTSSIILHPYLVFNIKRIVDNNIAVPLILIFLLLTLLIMKKGFNLLKSVFIGIISGLMVIVRPNFLFLLLIPFWFLFTNPLIKISRKIMYGISVLMFFLFTISLFTVPFTGKFFVLPKNGPYNFFAGANEFTEESILKMYNAEPSLFKYVEYYNINQNVFTIEGRNYLNWAFNYVKKHPIKYFYLTMLKFFNLFRPDYRHIKDSETIKSETALIIVQSALALPFLIWILTFLICGKTEEKEIKILRFGFFVLYVIPIILTNSDPRFRLPLDVFLICDLFFMLSEKL